MTLPSPAGQPSWPNERPTAQRTPLLIEQHEVAGVPVRLLVLPTSDGRWEAQLWAHTLAMRQICPTAAQAAAILYDWLALARDQACSAAPPPDLNPHDLAGLE